MIPVNELFDTIQGEARYTGTPSTFIRLQGCDVGCPWCDTKHTWALAKDKVRSFDDILAKDDKGLDTYAMVTTDELTREVASRLPRHVVITGGEPCDYDLTELTTRLIAKGRSVQIETSATAPIRVSQQAWVTVSPKFNMPGGKAVLGEALARADEIKMPIGKMADVQQLELMLLKLPQRPSLVWLQPLSTSPKATALCVEVATKHGWRVSVQTHKFIGVR